MNYDPRRITCIEENSTRIFNIVLAEEEPLSMRVQGKPYLIVMRTPGNEKAHVAGLCLAEGIIDEVKDITSIAFCDETDTNIVTITLTRARRSKIPNVFERKGYISNTSCGICGKEIVADISCNIKPIANSTTLEVSDVLENILCLNDYQPLRKKTKAMHCSAIYDKNSNLLSSAEDIGRHNALDKSIGLLLLNGNLGNAMMIVMSSRISYELVQKAARAQIPIIAAISRPTSLAVDLATKLNITLATLSQKNGLLIFCNNHHLSNQKQHIIPQ